MIYKLLVFRVKILVFLTLIWVQSIPAVEVLIPAPPKIGGKSHFLQDFYSGRVLAQSNADEQLSPASLTKIMTVYVVFREISDGHLRKNDLVTVSEKAWKTGGSKMFIEVNKQVAVEDLLKGVIIQSGNDASVALAEHIAGDEATFAGLMNQHAQRLGMRNTHFSNSMGLPQPDHHTTARDLAILTRAMIEEFPDYYPWHSIKEFTYNSIRQYNRNKLLWRDETVDGVKTGHTEDAGYCLVASALRDGMRLISVVMGADSEDARGSYNQALLNYGFRFFETHKLYKSGEVLTEARIWKGEAEKLALGLYEDLYVTIPRRHYQDLKATMDIDNRIIAPVKLGQSFGNVNVALSSDIIAKQPLVALQAMQEGGFFQRIYDEALLLVK